MKKTVPVLCLAFFLTCMLSHAQAEELAKAVVADATQVYLKADSASEVVEETKGDEILLVDAQPIHTQGSPFTWYRIRYAYALDAPNQLIQRDVPAYIEGRHLALMPLTQTEKIAVEREKNDRAATHSRKWKTTRLSVGVSDIVEFPMQGKIFAPLYESPDLGSRQIEFLPKGTPLLLSVAKLRYDELGVNLEGWVEITRPQKGWIPIQYSSLWYTDFYAGVIE